MKIKFLILIFFILISRAAFAPWISAQQVPSVSVTVNPDVLLPGVPFNLTFLINHSDPDEVIITSPSFPREFILDRMIKHPHSAGLQNTEIYTLAEYRIVTYSSGTFMLNSFQIQTPSGITETGAFNIIIRSPAPVQRYTTQSLRWEIRSLDAIAAGDRITLTLRANNYNSQQPASSFFMPQVPQGVILSSQSVSQAERHEGIIMKLLFIPLSAGSFSLPARVLEYDTIRFEIPALHLNIINRN